jgi:hypothetical protein
LRQKTIVHVQHFPIFNPTDETPATAQRCKMRNVRYIPLTGWSFWRAAPWSQRKMRRTTQDVQAIGAIALSQLGLGGLIFRGQHL